MTDKSARPCQSMILTALMIAVLLTGAGGGRSTAQAQSSKRVDEPMARYDYRRWDCKVKGDKFTLTESARITIFNRQGDKYARLAVGTNAFTKLKWVKTKIIDAKGNKIFKGDKKDMKKSCGYGSFNGYSDNCSYTMNLQASRYPYTVEYEYRLDSESLFFLRGHTFQSMIPVTEATYTLELPTSLEFQAKVYGLDLDPQVTEKKNKSTYVWQVTQIPGLEDVERVPPGYNEYIRLALCIARFDLEDYQFTQLDWRHVGHWYNQLAEDRYGLASQATRISAANQMAVARAVYNEVIADVRYVAIEIGVGGWQPYAAEVTAERAWGDCKDMSTLLIARLREQNIRALPALALTRSAGPVDADFPSFRFNHLIAAALIGNDTIWMDPTCSNCPFGDLPRSVENVDLLLISESGGTIVRTPLSDATDNKIVRKTIWRLEEGDMVSFTSSVTAYGNRATTFRYRLAGYDSDRQRQYAERQFRGVPKRLTTTSYHIYLPDSLSAPVTITLSGQAIRPCDRVGSNVYVAMMRLIGRSSVETVELDDRLLPIDIGYPWQVIDSIELVLTPELAAADIYLPEPDSLITSFGHVYLTTNLSDSLATIVVEKEYSVAQIDSHQLAEFAAFVDSLKSMTRTMTLIANQ